MKTLVIVVVIILAPVFCFATERVRGHFRDVDGDGIRETYVRPHLRTAPDQFRTNNFSHPGNFNPNTGEITPGSNVPHTIFPVTPNPRGEKRRGF